MCGIFGVYDVPKAAELTLAGLHAIQHRAIDYACIVASDQDNFYRHTGKGLARQVFGLEELTKLHGYDALGHLRYPTGSDDPARDNTQPIVGLYGGRRIAIAHNGNLTNTDALHETLSDVRFATSMDTECILRLLEANATGDIVPDLMHVFSMLKGSYALGILTPDALIAVQDPSGNRPFSIGRLNGGYCLSSETTALTNVGAEWVLDVEPGTMVCITKDGLKTHRFAVPGEKHCRFEGIYYAHPGSTVFGESVLEFRMKLGRALEESCPAEGADIVVPIPDSSNFIAMGYAQSGRSGAFSPVIMRSHYVGRTFIAATQTKRDAEVTSKFTFAPQHIRGKKVVLVDDSIVRGTTLPKIVRMVHQLGAKEIHVRIGAPPIRHPCTYGIYTPTEAELMAARLTTEEMRQAAGADSLEFLPLEVLKGLSAEPKKFCYACMDGNYW